MATKKTTKKATAVPTLKESAHDIWLAGLGAFAMAGEEGGKLFKQLVEKGSELESSNKERIERLVEKAEDLKTEAKGAAKKAVAPFETGLSTAMQKLGVPTRDEIVTLTKRVEELTKAVAKTKAAAQAKPAPKAKTASKSKAAEQTEG
jgi:poly(hydroxyalkanoate) granule-associated protein